MKWMLLRRRTQNCHSFDDRFIYAVGEQVTLLTVGASPPLTPHFLSAGLHRAYRTGPLRVATTPTLVLTYSSSPYDPHLYAHAQCEMETVQCIALFMHRTSVFCFRQVTACLPMRAA